MQTGTQAIDRAAQLLVLVVEGDEATTVGELAEAAGLPKSTVSRAVSALERQGLVQRSGIRGGIRPGPVLLGLARRRVSEADIVELCEPAMERLGERTGETVDLAVPVPGGQERYVAQVDSRHFLGTTSWAGRRMPHHCTAIGKVLLAFGAAELPRGPLSRMTDRSVTDRAVLRGQLDTVRACGYALAVEELEPGLNAVAAPVLGAGGTAVAAISVSGPAFRIPQRRLDEFGAMVVDETMRLSAQLGHTPAKEGAA